MARSEILQAGLIPPDLVLKNAAYRPEMAGFTPPGGVWTHVAGIDLARTGPEDFYVLEDNCRTPSGVSYMLENREAMLRLLPDLCAAHRIAPISHYPEELLETLKAVAPAGAGPDPTVVVLTPGPFNSAYYEHSFLADEMGVELVEGADLFVEDETVFMRTTAGPKRVDVIYRRIDDDFLDPEAFRPDSLLGVPGLMRAYKAGRVALANAPGAGVADDKSIYPHVPTMIRFYLGRSRCSPTCPPMNATSRRIWPSCWRISICLSSSWRAGRGAMAMLVGPHATSPPSGRNSPPASGPARPTTLPSRRCRFPPSPRL